MAEVAFSEDGKYFSAISQDGRLRIWDTETNVLKQEYTPDLHLSSPPSCLQWILIGNIESPRKGRRKSLSVSETQNQCIALGTTNGKILIYSVAEAKVETVLEDSKNSEIQNKAITSLDWHRNYGLFSSNKEGFVYEWDLRGASCRNKYNVIFDSKNKQASSVSAIKIVPHNQNNQAKFLVTASWQVRLWRLMDGTIDVVKILGHSGAPRPVLMLATLPNNRSWLIEGSQNERLLSFWDVTITQQNQPQVNGDDVSPTKKQRKKSTSDPVTVSNPSYNFVLEDAPKTVDVCVRQIDGGVKVNMAAATRSGVVHYYGHMLNGSSTKPIKPSVTIQVTTEDARPLPLQCCKFVQRSDAGECVLGYEPSPARIVFERVMPETKSKTQVLIRSDGKDKQTNSQTDEVNRVRSASTSEVTYVEPLGGVSRKRMTPGAKVEVPMEARLANLALDTKGRSQSAVNQNLTKLLVQGLHSKDRGLILTVLQSDDPSVALRTVSNLPADYVPQLLEQLADMATKKTSQCAAVCTWLSALLRSHSALLLATLNSRTSGDQVMQLLAIFTQRRSHLCQLLNLKGRLDLTITQRTSSNDPHSDAEPVLQYNDSSSDEEMELKYQSGSDEESWVDDKFEGTDDGTDGDT